MAFHRGTRKRKHKLYKSFCQKADRKYLRGRKQIAGHYNGVWRFLSKVRANKTMTFLRKVKKAEKNHFLATRNLTKMVIVRTPNYLKFSAPFIFNLGRLRTNNFKWQHALSKTITEKWVMVIYGSMPHDIYTCISCCVYHIFILVSSNFYLRAAR